MASVTFDQVTKRFGDVVAVDDLTLRIEDREFLVLLGPSGCGKSTALRMIAGLDEPTSGSICIGDDVVNGIDPRDRDIAMVFQNYALYPHMTVAANIEAPLLTRPMPVDGEATRKLNRHERSEHVRRAAAVLGLEPLLDRKPGELSGGQRQRVALARSIVRRPRAFLMDEPLSNLDAKLRTQTRLELVDLWRRLESTFVYVTHDQVEAMTMATRIAVIADGRLQQVGRPQDVYRRPANLFVARFIGSPPMNTFTARLVDTGSGPGVRLGDTVLALPAEAATDGAPSSGGEEVVVGVRPEHLRIDPSGPLTGIVRAIEVLGHEQHLVCDVADERLIVRESSDGPLIEVGEAVRLQADPDRLHLFDPAGGDRRW